MINRALDTNMLGGNPWVGPIFHEFHEKRGGEAVVGGRSDENREHTHTKHDTRRSLTLVATGPT